MSRRRAWIVCENQDRSANPGEQVILNNEPDLRRHVKSASGYANSTETRKWNPHATCNVAYKQFQKLDAYKGNPSGRR